MPSHDDDDDAPLSYLGQFSELVGVQQELLQAAGVAVDLIGHGVQGAVPLIHRLHVAVTPPERDALEHGADQGLRIRVQIPARGFTSRLALKITAPTLRDLLLLKISFLVHFEEGKGGKNKMDFLVQSHLWVKKKKNKPTLEYW